MKTKQIFISVLLIIIIAVPLYLFVLKQPDDTHIHSSEEAQLYTCGMHPEIISDEPGVCPICEMNLTPIKNDNKVKGEKK